VQTAGGVQILRTGDFFGEIAMLEQSLHQHAFTATSRARLLRLHREDFLRLERAHPDIGRHIRRVAAARKRADEQPSAAEPYGIDGITAGALAID
jgi:voltage-gated potassium channel